MPRRARQSEEWRPVVGSPGYHVSSLGRVRSPRGRILKPQLSNRGYHRVHLGRTRREHVHRLVMIAFVPFRQMDAEVDHVNHDRTDNRRDNLRWLSPGLNRVYWNGRREDGTIIWSTLAEMEPPEPVEPMTAEEQAAWAAEAAEQGW